MQKTLPAIFLVTALLLTACNKGPQTSSYSLAFDQYGQGRRLELISAAERVANRRIAAMGVKGTATVIPVGGISATMTAKVPDKDTADKLKTQLTDPFAFDIRVEKLPSANPAKEPLDNWQKTDITGDDIEWIQVVGDKTGKIGAELQFTTAGRAKLEKVFAGLAASNAAAAKNTPPSAGKPARAIGIFVRDFLISKLAPQGTQVQQHVIISGIPSATIAQIFADDVNVGVHVHFVPKP